MQAFCNAGSNAGSVWKRLHQNFLHFLAFRPTNWLTFWQLNNSIHIILTSTQLDNKKVGRDEVQEVCKKDAGKDNFC